MRGDARPYGLRRARRAQHHARAAQQSLENRGEKTAQRVEQAGDLGFVPREELLGGNEARPGEGNAPLIGPFAGHRLEVRRLAAARVEGRFGPAGKGEVELAEGGLEPREGVQGDRQRRRIEADVEPTSEAAGKGTF